VERQRSERLLNRSNQDPPRLLLGNCTELVLKAGGFRGYFFPPLGVFQNTSTTVGESSCFKSEVSGGTTRASPYLPQDAERFVLFSPSSGKSDFNCEDPESTYRHRCAFRHGGPFSRRTALFLPSSQKRFTIGARIDTPCQREPSSRNGQRIAVLMSCALLHYESRRGASIDQMPLASSAIFLGRGKGH